MNSPISDAADVIGTVLEQSRRILDVYRADPGHVQEHANNERRITQGGYSERQIYELVQNGADESQDRPGRGRIHVLLTATHLYCANTGAPVTSGGADTILRMAVSRKRGGQIGRFGVGVKSVLSVSDAPRFYSTSGCFGFDKAWSAQRIREVVPNLSELAETPVLRMAQPLDLAHDRAEDPVLHELMTWASTTVALPLLHGAAHRLGRDLRNFPSHFMLFSSHMDSVVLEDRRDRHQLQRVLRQTTQDTRTSSAEEIGAELLHTRHLVAEEANGRSVRNERWDVFHVDHSPSEEARKTAGELHERSLIRLSWAVPGEKVEARKKRGSFWAFFPTHYDTTLTGILNAPWKTPEDRQNLTKSDFNNELLAKAAELIVSSLPRLVKPDDPGSYLTLLTARGREASQWGDETLSKKVLEAAARLPSLPDQRGTLRRPQELRLHPEDLQEKWLELWAEYPGHPVDWCHRSVESRERRSRARDIMELAGVRPASVTEWLEALVADRTPAASALALRIVADMESAHCTRAVDARVLLTEQGDLIAPARGRGRVYRRSPLAGSGLQDDMTYVHPEVVADDNARHALEALGIPEADAEGRFKAVLDRCFDSYGRTGWEEFWTLLRQAGAGRAAVAIRAKFPAPSLVIKVRTADGAFRPIRDAFLAGPVVPGDGSRDAELLVDPDFHSADLTVLRELGATDRPVINCDPRADDWFHEYLDKVHKLYYKSLPSSARRPSPKTLLVSGANPAGPLHLLPRLSPEGRAAFVKHLPRHGLVQNWTLQVGSHRNSPQQVHSPIMWMLWQKGVVPTSLGDRRPSACLSPAADVDPKLLPVASIDADTARVLRLTADLASVPEALWEELFRRIHDSADAEFVGSAYALLTGRDVDGIPWPEDTLTRCQVGEEWTTRNDEEIAVTADREQYRILVRESVPALLVPTVEDAERMIADWPLKAPSELLQEELDCVVLGDPVQLTDLYPRLRQRLPRGTLWQLSHCSHLARVVRTPDGKREEPLTEARDADTVLLCGPDDELAVLCAVDRVLELRLGEPGCRAMLAQQQKDRENEQFLKVRQEPDPARKLLLALGAERLREELPPGLLLADEELNGQAPDELRIAQLVIATHGEEVLRQLSLALTKAGFDAPRRWTGGHAARSFVKTYGFPAEWAGDQEASQAPPPFETVQGPRKPRPLHQYQMRLVANMYQHLVQRDEKRSMLQIPTGAGKTRIAVEATVQAIADGVLQGPILWIAQSAELCEQAIETWKFVWSQTGPEQNLRISRMWGGVAAEPATTGPQIVVAVDDTLSRHLDTEPYAWLCDAALVIVDEAHFAVPKTYTKILDALGIDQHRTSRHLVGLTATAFRGNSEEETRRLAARFGHKRLDRDVFDGDDPYPHLQELGVLAQVEQRELPGGNYSLSPDQIAQVMSSNSMTLPAAVTARMARDVGRTKRIVEEIERLPQHWPVLVFGTSVEHAQVLAALLNESGITAAPVDSTTPTGVRNRRIDAFRNGKIQVLTNYNVLTQGFDAPAVRAVVVARPTFSPNTYVQMIGRGLRGPLNGGKDSCLILNVRDNIENFGRDLAYTEFEHLWEGNG
ncbi:DEAD/DEAH box helicase [Streptomyces sp. Isolate_219]|uniref:DEAD/DEAH box helicase n=1 Tax=Streptomyces sp. Isolate_219 TaxID=2950110 RepID=UPI0021C83CCD|nr:DEAD/DEAH box helicase family protein [Streptomyces sp. Isolate_219]MCR8575324.1 DEAD/DEAH box helicase family protein [Streptomyces sp. Isolate_219]